MIAAYTMTTDLAPESRRGEALSLVTVASYIGLAAGPAAADFILGDRFRLVSAGRGRLHGGRHAARPDAWRLALNAISHMPAGCRRAARCCPA